MAHRIGGGTWDVYLSVQLEIRSGLPVGMEIWGRQLTTRGGEIGGPKRGPFWLLEMSRNSGVLPKVYLHAGLEIGSAIPYAIHRESNGDSHALGSQRSPCHSLW